MGSAIDVRHDVTRPPHPRVRPHGGASGAPGRRRPSAPWPWLLLTPALAACASLGIGSAVRAPEVSRVDAPAPRVRLLLPGPERPAGGAAVRLWARVENPNAFSLTVSRLDGDLFLGDAEGVAVAFPLGLPLLAGRDTIVPLDASLDFDDLPALGEALVDALSTGGIPYRLEATIGVDAGLLGQPVFGPSTLLRGTIDVTR